MRSDLNILVINDEELATSSQLDVTFFKNSGLTRCFSWCDEFFEPFNQTPDFPKPWKIFLITITIIGFISCLVFLFCMYLNDNNQLNQLGVIITYIALVGILGMLPFCLVLGFYALIILIQPLVLMIGLIICIIQAIYFKTSRYQSLKGVLKEVKKYNQLIKAIDINDQLEAVNKRATNITDREKVIEALTLTRLDLIRALKTEKILWDNKGFMKQNSAIFVNSLEALESLKVRDKASEYGQFLDATLQVAINTERVLERLQNRH